MSLLGVRILDVDRPARRVRVRVFVVHCDRKHEPLPNHPGTAYGTDQKAAWVEVRRRGGRVVAYPACFSPR